MTVQPEDVAALRAALGADRLITDPAAVAELSADSSARSKKAVAGGAPPATAELAVRPADTDEVSTVVRWANEHGVPVTARGRGSGVVGSGLPTRGGVLLDLSALDAIGPVNETDQLVTVGAGTLGSELEAHLEQFGLTTGHYPQSLHLASVGGWVAMRGSGTFSSLHGNIEERVADLQVVLPTGEVLDTRSVPRASEGPDLKQLFIGSEGTLGVITAVTLRLVRRPAARRFAAVLFDGLQPAVDAVREILGAGVRPAVVRVYDPAESKAKHARFSERDGWLTVLLFDGDAQLVRVQEDIALGIAERHGAEVLGPEPAEHWEQRRFDWSWFSDMVGRTGGIAEAIEVTTTWSRLPELYEAMSAAARTTIQDVMGHVSHVYDQGASLYLIVRGEFGTDAEALRAYDATWQAVMEVVTAHGARISHHHGIGLERAAWLPAELGETGMDVLRSVKRTFDPGGIMNPGKMGL